MLLWTNSPASMPVLLLVFLQSALGSMLAIVIILCFIFPLEMIVDEASGKFSTSSNMLLLVRNDSCMKYETPGERDNIYSLKTGFC